MTIDDEADDDEPELHVELRQHLFDVRRQKEEAIMSQDFASAADLRAHETELGELLRSMKISTACPDPPHQQLIRKLIARIRDLQAEVGRLKQSSQSST